MQWTKSDAAIAPPTGSQRLALASNMKTTGRRLNLPLKAASGRIDRLGRARGGEEEEKENEKKKKKMRVDESHRTTTS